MSSEQAISQAERGRTLRPVFVYQWPVRLWHWVNVLCILVLAATGYYLGNPLLPSMAGEASQNFFIGYVRFAHFAAAYVFAIGFLGRVYWAFAGNEYSRYLIVPEFFKGETWTGAWRVLKYYLFLEKDYGIHVGSNPLNQIATFLLFTVPTIFLILTGFGLYAEGLGKGSWAYAMFGWVLAAFGDSQSVHTWHRVAMWVLICYVIVHVYLALRADILSRESSISTMFSGYRLFKD